MLDFHSLSFVAQVYKAFPDAVGRYDGPLLSGPRLRVAAVKPNLLRVEDARTPDDYAAASPPHLRAGADLLVCDGVSQVETLRTVNRVRRARAPRELADLRSRSGLLEVGGVEELLRFDPARYESVYENESVYESAGGAVVLVYARLDLYEGSVIKKELEVEDAGGGVYKPRLIRGTLREGGRVVFLTRVTDWDADPDTSGWGRGQFRPPAPAAPSPAVWGRALLRHGAAVVAAVVRGRRHKQGHGKGHEEGHG